MKTFITGGTGFIGTHLVRRMAQTEHEMVCLARESSDVSTLKEVGATVIRGDVTDRASMLDAMQACEWLINLANVYTFWEPDKQIYAKVNIEGTQNVMECALEAGISKVLHVSTMLTYGKPSDVPFTEESNVGPVRFSEYAETKYQGDRVVWELHRAKDLPAVVVYPSGVMGPGDDKASGRYVQDLVESRRPATAFDDAILTWVHVADVAEIIVRALEKEDNIGGKYLAGKEQLSIRELNELVSEISGVSLPGMRLPGSVAMAMAGFLTGLADRSGTPPRLNMAADQCRTMREGFQGDGSKAERDLGITYTPVRLALEEAISLYRTGR